MPLFDFECCRCEAVEEHFLNTSGEGVPAKHEGCGGDLRRAGVQAFQIGKPSFVPGAILATGEKIPGHFGRDAPMKKPRWNRP